MSDVEFVTCLWCEVSLPLSDAREISDPKFGDLHWCSSCYDLLRLKFK